MQTKIKQFLSKYKHSILILYFPLYMVWFLLLEKRADIPHYIIHCPLDDMIPFQEIFIIPYLLWFFYVAAVLVYLFFQTDYLKDFYRCAAVLMLGMTTCLIIYTLFPNAQDLRPQAFPRDNALTRIIAALYQGDTSTNVCPSIHVYNSLAIHAGLSKSHYFLPEEKGNSANYRGWKLASLILCILICLSTLFLKQHSVIDMACSIILFGIYYPLVYKGAHSSSSQSRSSRSK